MKPFTYARPADLADAVAELTDSHTRIIAGGTNLIDLMKENVERPRRLVDINRLPLTTISELPDGGLRLGALVSNADTAYHPLVQERYPLLSKTILAGASPQLRNMATNGGNLFQRTRCAYFYDTSMPCNKRVADRNAGPVGCGAIGGYNRIHAILGTTNGTNGEPTCIATYPSDMAVALAALDATVQLTGPNGDRSLPILDFHRLPGTEAERDNTVEPGEVVTAIDLPARGFAEHYDYVKIRDRASYAFALVSVAVGLEMDGDVVRDIRIALGGVAHKPWRKPDAEQLLVGETLSPETIRPVADALLDGAKGYGHNNFKLELARRAIVRAVLSSPDTLVR